MGATGGTGATGATGGTGSTGATGATGGFTTAFVGADATPSSTYVFASGTLPFPTNTAGPSGGMTIDGATGTVTVLFAFSWLSDLTAGDTLAIKFTGITPSQAQIVSANLSVEKAS